MTSLARVFDPICGMWLEPVRAASTLIFMGQTYAFCCAECRDLFAGALERQVAHLAHEPTQRAGYCCPHRRQSGKAEPR